MSHDFRRGQALTRSTVLILGGLALLLVLPSVLRLEPYRVDLGAILQPPSVAHPLGTDENGRDILARLVVGARGTLGIGLGATVVAVTLGTLIGGVAGYRGGWFDALLMRLTDIALAFPSLFVVLLLAAVISPGFLSLIALIGGTGWMTTARLVRTRMQELLTAPYVEAARSLGAGSGEVITHHLLPSLHGLVGVAGLVQLSRAILAEATISFLGFGVQPPTPTWGNLLIGAQNYVFTAPWLALAPGVAITGTALALATLTLGGRPRPTSSALERADGPVDRRWPGPRVPSVAARPCAPHVTY